MSKVTPILVHQTFSCLTGNQQKKIKKSIKPIIFKGELHQKTKIWYVVGYDEKTSVAVVQQPNGY